MSTLESGSVTKHSSSESSPISWTTRITYNIRKVWLYMFTFDMYFLCDMQAILGSPIESFFVHYQDHDWFKPFSMTYWWLFYGANKAEILVTQTSTFYVFSKIAFQVFPGGAVAGQESICQRRDMGPVSGPGRSRAAGRKSVCHNFWAYALQLRKPEHLEPMLCNNRSLCSEKPVLPEMKSSPSSPQLEGSLRAARTVQHSQKPRK